MEGLSLPSLTPREGTQNRDMWKSITYEIFASQLQQKNPDAVLTKQTADLDLRSAVDHSRNANRGRESAVARISHDSHLCCQTSLPE